MAHGGARPGAGRPKGSGAKKSIPKPSTKAIGRAAKAAGKTPLEFMLDVMNDVGVDMKFRAQMAVAAAPYVHAKPTAGGLGKKETAEQASATAGAGTAWGDDLAGPPVLN